MSLTVTPLSPALGAEISGIDLDSPLDQATIDGLLAAWNDHLVLLFRQQNLSEDAQVRFARYFGALQQRSRPKDTRPEPNVRHREIMLISNIRENGKLIGSLPDGEVQFHSDNCFVEKPPKGTFLYAIEIPSEGGDTVFVNMYKAYEALTPEIKRALDGKKALNIFQYGATTRDSFSADFERHPHFSHPVVRTHPQTRRKALFVNRLMSWRIESIDTAESDALLAKLFDHIEQPQFIYAHKWRVGDMLLWDNRCTLHARTDFSDKERRLMRRVTIEGEIPV